LRLAFKHNPKDRTEVSTVRAQLSQLHEELRLEAGGPPQAPPEVLAAAYGRDIPGGERAVQAPATGALEDAAATPKVTLKSKSVPPAVSADTLASSPPTTAASAPPPGPGTPPLPPPQAVDFLGIGALSLADAVPVSEPQQVATRAAPAASPPARSPTTPPPAPGAEPVVITACSDGALGIKALFRAGAELIPHPSDGKQMTAIAVLPPEASGEASREAVSVSAAGTVTHWDMSEGVCLGATKLIGARLPPGAVGRSIAANARQVIIGTDRSRVSLWTFPGGGASWLAANADRAPTDQVHPPLPGCLRCSTA
jgi:hypothetical protein